MKNIRCDIAIIGGGPAGLAAAISAKENGCDNILILEREDELGGILNQCIHNGFGLHTFKEELTGPEYAERYIEKAESMNIPYMLGTFVVDITMDNMSTDILSTDNISADNKSADKIITAVSRDSGLIKIETKAIILAMGCRERPRGALNIPGFRPAGVFSAGTAQKLVNLDGYMPGKEVVILGSGDIGLIMARRMTLEGAKVQAVAEIQPFSGGLKRNIVQCLDDYSIPLLLSHTVVSIEGKERVEGVIIAQVDENFKPIKGTEKHYSCDTLLLSVGLIPENELSKQIGISLNPVTNGPEVNEMLETNSSGVFACGNVLHVHDLVDYVSEEAHTAGKNAVKYVQSSEKSDKSGTAPLGEAPFGGNPIEIGGAVRYTVPYKINPENAEEQTIVRFRVGKILKNAYICVYVGDKQILRRKKQIMAPGEMEQVVLKKEDIISGEPITICTEEGENL